MKPLVTDRVGALAGYTPGEQPRGGRLIKLNTNENPYPPSGRIAEAVARAAGEGLELYPSAMADELRERAASHYGVRAEQVLAGNGSDEILSICLRACVDVGDRVAYTTPTYSLYRTLCEIAGAEVVEVPSRFCADLADTGARVCFVCNPNSPLGYGVPAAEIEALAGSVDGLVVSDEAYVDFGDTSAIGLVGKVPNLLVVRTFSKSFSLAGARLGLAFADAGLIAELAKVKDSYNVSRLAIAAGVAALDDHETMVSSVARVRATRERVAGRLREGGYDVPDSSANFLWVGCGDGARDLYQSLRQGGVLVRYFDAEGLRGGVRVTIGTDEHMDRFLELALAAR